MSAAEVIRSLRQIPDVHRIIGTDIHSPDTLPNAYLLDRFYPSHRADHEAFLSSMLTVCQTESITHLLVLTDPEVDVLASEKAVFDRIGTTVCISDEKAVKLARDKWSLYQRFLTIPEVDLIPTYLGGSHESYRIDPPFVVKPRTGRSSEGLRLVTDSVAKPAISALDIVQPMLKGPIFTVDVVRSPDGRTACVPRKEVVRSLNGAGLVVDIVRDDELEALAVRVVAELDLTGAVNLEFILVDGRYLLMDLNPRFSAGIAFSRLVGYDVVSNHLRCFRDEPIDHSSPLKISRLAKIHTEIDLTAR